MQRHWLLQIDSQALQNQEKCQSRKLHSLQVESEGVPASEANTDLAVDGGVPEEAGLGMGLFDEEQPADWEAPQAAKPSRDDTPQLWGSYGSSAKSQRVKKGSGEAYMGRCLSCDCLQSAWHIRNQGKFHPVVTCLWASLTGAAKECFRLASTVIRWEGPAA